MELLAIASGSALTGALIMAIFVLGTSPLFAILGYTLRRAGSVLGGNVGKLAAVAVLVVGLLTVNNGLALTGSSLRLSGASARTARAPQPEIVEFPGTAAEASSSENPSSVQKLIVEVEDTGYSPSLVGAKAGVPTTLVLVTEGTLGCTRAFVFPDRGIQKILPGSGKTELNLGTLRPGMLEFTCSMGMY